MKTYTTKSGDMWDLIAFEQLGSSKFVRELINANREQTMTYIFAAGVTLIIPGVETTTTATLPPWRR